MPTLLYDGGMRGLFSWFSSASATETLVLVHIGSASIGIGLAEVGEGKPKVIFTARELLPYQQNLDFDRLLGATEKALETLSQKLLKEGVLQYQKLLGRAPRVNRVQMVLSSPWYVSKTIDLSLSKDRPTHVTVEMIGDMVRTAKEKLEADIEAGKLPQIGEDAVLLEEWMTTISLDGYPMTSPFGKHAKEIRVALFLSFISSVLKGRFKAVLGRSLHDFRMGLHSFALVSFSLVRDLFPKEHTFLLMDVDGEVTDVSLIKDDVLVETASFPCGKYSVLRCLGEEAGPAESRVSLLRSRGVESESVEKAKEEWLIQYKGAIEGLAEHNAIPEQLFITAHADVLPWFKEVLEGYEGGKGVFAKPRTVVPITEAFFASHVEVFGGAHYDVYLAMLLLFFNKQHPR